MDEREGRGFDTTNSWSRQQRSGEYRRKSTDSSGNQNDNTTRSGSSLNDKIPGIHQLRSNIRMPGSKQAESPGTSRVSGAQNTRFSGSASTQSTRISGSGRAAGSRFSGNAVKPNSRVQGEESQTLHMTEEEAQQSVRAAARSRTRSADSSGRRRRSGQRPRRGSRARRRRRNLIFRMGILVAFLIALVVGIFIWKKYGPSKEKADLEQYYGLMNENDLAVIINNQVIRDEEGVPVGKLMDDQVYVEYSVVRHNINERFYWDPNESVMLYTLPNGNVSVAVGSREYTEINEKKSEDYVILKTEGRTAYIALPFIQQYTNMDYSVYKKPDRAVITCEWGEIQTASVKRNTEVRYQGGVKSPILTEAKKSDRVTVLEEEGDWKKVATTDGFVGYVKNSSLRKIESETLSREFEAPEYSNLSVSHTINMAWHSIENQDANSYVLEMIAATKGLTTIAPTWFTIADLDGNINSLASTEYVNYAHQQNLDVWATLRDFHGGINSFEETYQVLSYTSKRETLINQVIAAALQSGIDGINLDFELISTECGEHYIQFVRELSVKCRQNSLVLSIDNYVPQPYNAHYNLKEQGIVADYVIIMGYDEHTEGSYEAGSVASYGYVKKGIEDALQSVPSTKLVTAVPLYTRLWFESPKSQEELDAQQGTEAAQFPNNVTSTAMGMDEAVQTLNQYGVQAEWNEEAKQNYAQWEADGGMYKIWLEDETSLEEKLKLIKGNNLAGVAEWRLGWENSSAWDLILQYVN